MSKKRKLPFGYMMEYGRIRENPKEGLWVQFIFTQYLSGSSLKEIAEYMSMQGVPYDTDKPWNKNMIARILEDQRYCGSKDYASIIELEVYEQVAERKGSKRPSMQKTDAQKVLRRKCGFPITAYIEQEVTYMINQLICNPDRVKVMERIIVSESRLENLKTELDDLLAELPVDEVRAKEKIMDIAVTMYEAVDPRIYESYRISEMLKKAKPSGNLDSSILDGIVSEVSVDTDGNVVIRLKNDQMIQRG